MAFDISNIVINRPLRGIAFDDVGSIIWTVDQIKDPSLTMSSEKVTAAYALGVPIMEFDRSKSCEFSATQAVFDLGLLAAQSGTTKEVASATNSIVVPMWETVKVTADQDSVTLKQTPNEGSMPYIWELKADRSLSTRYIEADAASETEFQLVGNTLTLPNRAEGDTAARTYLIPYEYSATGAAGLGAVKITNSADKFASASKFVLKCLGHNVCDKTTEYAIWLIFDNAKLSSDFDLTLSPEMEQQFSMTIMTNYCDENKPLFSIIMPEAVAE